MLFMEFNVELVVSLRTKGNGERWKESFRKRLGCKPPQHSQRLLQEEPRQQAHTRAHTHTREHTGCDVTSRGRNTWGIVAAAITSRALEEETGGRGGVVRRAEAPVST